MCTMPLYDDDLQAVVSFHSVNELTGRIKSQKGKSELDLSVSKITFVPLDDIMDTHGESLTSLDLSYNLISTLTSRFMTDLANLTKLNLGRNYIKKLPEEFGSLTKLTHLDLNENLLETLPVSMSKLTQLEYLNIFNNPFRPPLSTILENEIAKQRSSVEIETINVAAPIVKFLKGIAQLTLRFPVKETAPIAPAEEILPLPKKKSIIFDFDSGLNLTPRDRERIEEIYTQQDELRKSTVSISGPPRQVNEAGSLHQVSATRSSRVIISRVDSASVLLKTYANFPSLTKGLAGLVLLTFMLLLILAMMADQSYLEGLVQDHPGFGPVWKFCQPIHSLASAVADKVNPPLVIRGPVPQPSLITIFISSISQMFRYVVEYFIP